ncbi:unnamed protein product [Arctia plantaginis]|uniref:Carboxylesterase type B domain-containing protein n=1 Tax=Arctia plantaginis TaxID=874455 RepID=A0A8S0YQZ5_ARCPL|nr:unnamed protein product [Arctia plantaginis]
MFLSKCLALIFLYCTVQSQLRIDPLVQTSVGLIKGLRADDGDYSMFLGIPFGQVDVNNPFGVAKPYPAFENTFEAFNDSTAIIQSATSLSPIFREPLKNAPIVLAEFLGYPTNDMDEALNFLVETDSQLVMAAVRNLGLDSFFRPCIEKEFDGVESFLTENWITAKIPKIKNIPILIGFNSDEQYYKYTSENDEYYQNLNIFETVLPLGFDADADEFNGMKDIVRHFYFADEPISATVKQGVIDFDSDFNFVHPTYRSISKYLDNEVGNIFLYVFSYVGERNYLKDYLNISEATGAAHCDETGYLFDIFYMKTKPITPEDQVIIDQSTTMLANFVKFGNPTPEVSALLPIQWTPITSKSMTPAMNIDSPLKLENRPFNERVTFWDLFYRANAYLQIAYPSAKVSLTDNS